MNILHPLPILSYAIFKSYYCTILYSLIHYLIVLRYDIVAITTTQQKTTTQSIHICIYVHWEISKYLHIYTAIYRKIVDIYNIHITSRSILSYSIYKSFAIKTKFLWFHWGNRDNPRFLAVSYQRIPKVKFR